MAILDQAKLLELVEEEVGPSVSSESPQLQDIEVNEPEKKKSMIPAITKAATGGSLTNLALEFIDNSDLTPQQKLLFQSLAIGSTGDTKAAGRFAGNVIGSLFER